MAMVAGMLTVPIGIVEQWEQGKLLPSSAQWERLCRLFGLDMRAVGESLDGETTRESKSVAFLLLTKSEIAEGNLLAQPGTMQGRSQDELDEKGREALPGGVAIYDPDLPVVSRERLIGRDGLLTAMKLQLCDGNKVVLYGLPGSGKTALAVALAHDPEIRQRFSDGVLWAGLGRQPHLQGLFSHWGALLKIDASITETLKSTEAWISVLHNFIGPRNILIVVDDVWQIEDVRGVQSGGPNCAYVLTTRLASIATAFAADHALLVPELLEGDGLRLLAQFAPTVLKDEQLSAQQLVRSVGGLPLALTLIGKYLRTQTTNGRPQRLRTALDNLQNVEYRLYLSSPTAPGEQPVSLPDDLPVSLQSVIAVSDQQLQEPARRALHALSILPAKPSTFGREVALIVSGEHTKTLTILSDAGLLEQIGFRRYMLHQTVADYARMQLSSTEPFRRLVAYGERFLAEHLTDERALERELATLIVALEYAFERGLQPEFVHSACLIAPFLSRRGFYPLAEQILQRAYGAALQLKDNPNIIQITYYLGTISQKRGVYPRATELLREGLALARQMEERGQISHLLIGLGALAKEQGNYAAAREFYQEGLILARQMEDQEQISHLLIGLGVLAKEQGDYTAARELYQEGLALARHLNDREQISTALKNLGVVESEQGNYAQAETFYQEGLKLAQKLEHRDLMSSIFMSLGNLAKERGQYSDAESYLQQGLTLARQMGHQERISVILSNLGVLEDARSDYTCAEAYLREGLDLARKVGHRERISLILLNLGVIAERQGREKQAEQHYQEALDLARQLGHQERISLLLLNLGDIAVERNHFEQAEAYLREGMILARKISHQERISDLYLHLGIMATRQGRESQAQEYLDEGLRIARQINNRPLICTQLYAEGELYLQREQSQEAGSTFREMLALAPATSQKVVADAEYGLARVAVLNREYEEARRLAESSLNILNAVGHRRADSIRTFLEDITKRENQQQ